MSDPSTPSTQAGPRSAGPGSTFFPFRPGERVPAILSLIPPESGSQNHPSSEADPEAHTSTTNRQSVDGAPWPFAPLPMSMTDIRQSVASDQDVAMQRFKGVLEEKMMLVKLLFRCQKSYEEHEAHLRRYISEEDIKKLVSNQSPIKRFETETVYGKYFNAVCGHNLRSFNP